MQDDRRLSPQRPSNGILLKSMEFEWQDHFQTRSQTWKTLEIEAILALGLVGIDWQLDKRVATLFAAMLLVLATIFGMLITHRHRLVEIQKFTNIIEIENALGLQSAGFFQTAHVPDPIYLRDAFRFTKSNTALFIFRMHVLLLLFGVVYGTARLLD